MHTFNLRINTKGLLLVFSCLAFFVQNTFSQQSIIKQPKHYNIQPGTRMPGQVHHQGRSTTGHSNLKSLVDTSDVLDYNTYNEVVADQLGISYTGSFNQSTQTLLAEELSSFITAASGNNGDITYAQVIFDSLAFANYAAQSTYSLPLAASTIRLDSIGLMTGIWGDTVIADGIMASDSFVVNIYSVTGGVLSAAPVTSIVNSGYAGLQQFFAPTTYLKYVSLPVGYTFTQGQGFAVKVIYLNKDTSSHCNLCYGYADSCNTIIYQSETYQSPAYPPVFAGSSSMGEINAVGTDSASEMAVTNLYYYSLSGVSQNCSYEYQQNWQILSYVSVSLPYSTFIQSNQTTACNGSSVNLSAQVYGTDSTNITYTWAVTGGATLQNTNSANTILTMPANVTNNATVTLTINDGSGNVADSLVIINCHLNIVPGTNQTVCTNSNVALQPAITGGTPPYTYQWQASAGSLSCTTCANPTATVGQNVTYTVIVTDAAQTTVTTSYSYTVNGISNTVTMAVSNSGTLCSTTNETTSVTVSGGTSPYSINWGNDSVTSGGSSQVFTYSQPSTLEIITVTDANGCVDAYLDTIASLAPTITVAQAILPTCPNSANGEIITSVTGGLPPYAYYWNNTLISDTLTNAEAGWYQLVVIDANGCSGTLGYNLSPLEDYAYYVYLNTTNQNCNQSGNISTLVNGGIPPYTYSWSDGEITASIQQPIGLQYYQLTVTDSAGCQAYGYTYVGSSCVSIINGTAFYDSTGTCNLASGTVLQGVFITATSSIGNVFYANTDINGNYSIQVSDTGTYSLGAFNYFSNTCGNLTFCGNTNQTVYVPVIGDTSNNNNIGFMGSIGFNLGIHPGWTSADPGFTKQYWVFYYNSSPTPYNGPATVTFNYDPNLVYLYTDEMQPTTLDTIAHIITWQVNSAVSTSINILDRLDAYFQVPSTLSLNYQLQSRFSITPITGDCDTSDNSYSYSETVIGSHDPNEKTVSPSGPVTADDSILTYTIHFQNTGTDSTHFVIIKDTLSPNLDPVTVRNTASSDMYSAFDVSCKGILTWTFNPLRVVDSAADPNGSKRFITFTVKKKANLPIGTAISNTASVYFDYNTAVVTNTVTDTEALPTYIFEIHDNNNISVKAFPNPFNDVTHIVVNGINEKFGFELYDVTGRLQQAIPSIENNQFDIHKGQLANGVYLYRILVTGKAAAYGKLVVE